MLVLPGPPGLDPTHERTVPRVRVLLSTLLNDLLSLGYYAFLIRPNVNRLTFGTYTYDVEKG